MAQWLGYRTRKRRVVRLSRDIMIIATTCKLFTHINFCTTRLGLKSIRKKLMRWSMIVVVVVVVVEHVRLWDRLLRITDRLTASAQQEIGTLCLSLLCQPSLEFKASWSVVPHPVGVKLQSSALPTTCYPGPNYSALVTRWTINLAVHSKSFVLNFWTWKAGPWTPL